MAPLKKKEADSSSADFDSVCRFKGCVCVCSGSQEKAEDIMVKT